MNRRKIFRREQCGTKVKSMTEIMSNFDQRPISSPVLEFHKATLSSTWNCAEYGTIDKA